MVCTKKPLLVLIVESRGFFGSANNASCLDNAFVSLHLRIPPRVLHFSALVFFFYDKRTQREHSGPFVRMSTRGAREQNQRPVRGPTGRSINPLAPTKLVIFAELQGALRVFSVMKSQAVSLPTARCVFALHWHLFFRVLKRNCATRRSKRLFFREIS